MGKGKLNAGSLLVNVIFIYIVLANSTNISYNFEIFYPLIFSCILQ